MRGFKSPGIMGIIFGVEKVEKNGSNALDSSRVVRGKGRSTEINNC